MSRKIVVYSINDTIPAQAIFLYARERFVGKEFEGNTVVDFYYELPMTLKEIYPNS